MTSAWPCAPEPRLLPGTPLNEEWVEFEVVADSRDLVGDGLHHRTSDSLSCRETGWDLLQRFPSLKIERRHRVRI